MAPFRHRAGREVLASSFVDGVYFGAPCRLRWGLAPTRRQVAPAVRRQVEELHGLVRERMAQFGVGFAPGRALALPG